MFNGPVFLNETIQANARAVNAGGISESLDEANALYSRLSGASFELVPSSFRGGTLYSGAPGVNGDLTWTRASDAFRTNASGLIQRVPWNLAQRSEEFDNSIWSKMQSTITANATTAPNGTLTADNFVPNTTNSDHQLSQSTNQATIGNTYTISVYAKPNGYNFIRLSFGNVAGGGYTFFNVSNGTIGGTSGMLSNSITPVGDGWYRCTVSRTTTTSGTLALDIYVVSSNNQFAWAGNGTDGIFIWGAQLVEGTTAQTYLPTTDRLNFPRLSYMYGSCPSVLLEPQRTNTILNSVWAGGGTTPTSWTKQFTGTTSPVTSIKCENVIAYNFNGVAVRGFFSQVQSFTTGTTYAFSIYVESVSVTNSVGSILLIANASGTTTYLKNNVSILSTENVVEGNTYTLIFNATSTTTTAEIRVGLGSSGGSPTGNFTLSMPQLEVGAYTTTYIPTTSATATRVADSFSRSNIFTNGLITSSGGTWFVELRGNVVMTRDTTDVGLFIGNSSNGVTGDVLSIRNNGANTRLIINKRIAGTQNSIYTTTTDTTKIAIKWDGTNADVFANGTKVVSATAFTATNMEFFNGTGSDVTKFIQQMALWRTPLTDAECIALTL